MGCGCSKKKIETVYKPGRGYVNVSKCIGDDCIKRQVQETQDTVNSPNIKRVVI